MDRGSEAEWSETKPEVRVSLLAEHLGELSRAVRKGTAAEQAIIAREIQELASTFLTDRR